jgi:hypothetical protein
MKSLQRALVGFGRFWWDFLVGDTPEIFITVVMMLSVLAGVSMWLHHVSAAVYVYPVVVLSALLVSVRRAIKR